MRVARVNPRQGSDSTTGLEGAYANPDRTLVVTPTPNYVYPQSGYAVGGFPYPGIEELRKMANGTSNHMGGPMGEAEAKSSPAQVRVLRPSTSTTRAFDKACTCGAGEHRRPSLLPGRKVRVVRTSAPWVSIDRFPR